MADVAALAEVALWDRLVGAVAEETDGTITFEYDPDFRRSGLEISPLKLPLSHAGPITFPELARVEAFAGLPGVLADALPDRFGNAIIERSFRDKGRPDAALSPVQKLLYIGSRAIGALEFRPAIRLPARTAEQESIEVAALVAQARLVVEGRTDVALPDIMRVGASAGGARPKAVILWNRSADTVRSGFAKPRPGDEPWIIKFDGVGELGAPDSQARPYNRVEYAYSRLARDAGVDVPETALVEDRGLGHFLSRRFDRAGGRRLHVHSLGGLQHADYNAPGTFSYESYLRTVVALKLDYRAIEEAFRRAVFNVAAVNQDDHVKNFGFLMDDRGAWRLSPAYDLTFARGAGFTRRHQMTLGGKTDGFTRDDVLALGAAAGLRQGGAAIVDRVTAALERWPEYAEQAGVPEEHAAAVRAAFRAL